MSPCPDTDQRGVRRPQNGKCDAGAYEYEGPPPDPDDDRLPTRSTSPDRSRTRWTRSAFTFTGTDNMTRPDELQFECRLVELELTEEPGADRAVGAGPARAAVGARATARGSVPLIEEGSVTLRGPGDRPGRQRRPDAGRPPLRRRPTRTRRRRSSPRSRRRSATAAPRPSRFSGIDNMTPPQFMEYECRLDTRDPDLWLECFNPVDVLQPDDRHAHVRGAGDRRQRERSTRPRRATPGRSASRRTATRPTSR